MNAKLILVLLFSMMLGSCADEKEDNSRKEPETTLYTFRLTLNDPVSTSNRTADVETITKVSVYIFDNDVFYKAHRDITADASGSVSLPAMPDSKLYFISGMAEPSSLSILEEGKTTLATFLAQTSDAQAQHGATQAPSFYSGMFVLAEADRSDVTHTIKLTRALARFDLDCTRDPRVKIDRIVIENAAASTLLFAGTTTIPNLQRRAYERTFTPAFGGDTRADLFRIYESNDPVKVTVYSKLDDIPVVIRMELPLVKRNYVYKLVVKNEGAEIEGIFEVKPWEDGGTVEGFPDVTEKIVIDRANSVIPDNVTIVDNQNEVKVPNSGADMTLAFLADARVDVATTDGLTSDVKIIPLDPITTPAGVVSKFRVTVAAQGKGRLPYQVILHVKSALQSGIYDQVRVSVAASAYQIEEVQLGGMTWMAFNARSRNLEDQIYVLDGCSVEEMYEKNWLTTIGGLFQWGRLYMYTPWESGTNNMGQQNQNVPWNADTHVPCPAGYRVPTKAELRALLPDNQTIPGTYLYNGERITASLHTSSVDFKTPTNNLTGKGRYISLMSETGQKLLIPLAGHKGDKSSSNNPSFGQGIFLWPNDLQGATGGWAWGVKFWPGNAQIANVVPNAQLQAEGFAYVRCIKK